MSTMTQSLPTLDLFQAGQSPWLDYISREILESGELQGLIEEKGLKGVTSNPSIFEKAISKPNGGYDAEIARLVAKGDSTFKIYDKLTISDIQKACDLFLPVFTETQGGHGFVSLEVAPSLSYLTDETVREARRLYKAVDRPNVMIKIPATPEGIPAIEEVIADGINVNVTLMFSMKHYRDVALAYIRGLKRLRAKKGSMSKVHSVASVFVSRIDTLIDKKLETMAADNPELLELRGKAAVANSKMIYQEFQRIFESAEFQTLQRQGAHVQKVLWGSTSCKNPAYSDLIYVEPLVGMDTVNTMPQPTLDAVLDHGRIRPGTVEEGAQEARQIVSRLNTLGLDLVEIGEKLQKDGVKQFVDAFDGLMKSLELKRLQKVRVENSASAFTFQVPAAVEKSFHEKAEKLQKSNFLERFLKADPTLWKSDASHQAVINNRMGWLRVQEWVCGKLHEIDQLAVEVRADKIEDLVLLGMGGSSLAPEVLSLICKRKKSGIANFYMLDTTDPYSILKVEKKLRLKKALFIVASKSGGTVETVSQYRYFYEKVKTAYGKNASLEAAGRHFLAITDEGSSLQKTAVEKKFRRIFINPSNVGGRFSALSLFGMVPASLLGLDARAILKSANDLFTAFSKNQDLSRNLAVAPGILMAVLAEKGFDKLTLAGKSHFLPFGAWVEQLVAESTGKEKKGVVPIDTEEPAEPAQYGKDRAFVFLGKSPESKALAKAGFPVMTIDWTDPNAVGAEFLRWEIATSVAGVVMGINPFDEPNVKESKDATGRLLDQFKKTGKFDKRSLVPVRVLEPGELFSKVREKKYIALLGYLDRSPQTQRAFDRIRAVIRTRYKVPVLLGFGPRYLHSIGQLYKGGTPNGVFVQFFIKDRKDMKVPGEVYSFGQLKTAQGLGDKEAIESKGLPVTAVDLGPDVLKGLKIFEKKVTDYRKK